MVLHRTVHDLQPSLLRPRAFDLQTNIFLINLSSIFIKVLLDCGHCPLLLWHVIACCVRCKMYSWTFHWKLSDGLQSQHYLTPWAENFKAAISSSFQRDYLLSSSTFYSSSACTVPCPPHYIHGRKFYSYIFPFVNLLEKVPLSEETYYAHWSRL